MKRILILILLAVPAYAQKIFISADMEGIGGVVTNEQLGPTGFEYQRARELMTEEYRSFVEARARSP
jgi:D-amino peptidase